MNHRVPLLDFAVVAVQLALVLVAALVLRLEIDRALAVAGFAGFAVHAWLPTRWRLPFVLALTAALLAVTLGPASALLVAGTGLGLIGICHLPILWPARVALAVAAAVGLAFLRAPWVLVLASMFMFRLALYLHDLRRRRTPAGLVHRLVYFFLPPNVTFLLFPVVDYRTFVTTYYTRPAADIYQKGVWWIFRGVCQLVLHRLLYTLVPAADALPGVLGVYAFMALTFGLYLRVSGLFHLITGLLALFGFDLPATHDRYFLARGFADLWRRANIYWRDFMALLVFKPAFFAARWLPTRARILIATGAVVVATWALHAYQWFWLRGEFPVSARELLFYALLGVGLLVSAAREKKPTPGPLLAAAQTLGFFSLMAALWTLWQSESIAAWGYRLARVAESGAREWAIFAAGVAVVLALGVAAPRFARLAVPRGPWVVIPGAALLLLCAAPLAPRPNRADRDLAEQGYYDGLIEVNPLTPDVREEDRRPFAKPPLVRRVKHLRVWELAPGASVKFGGVTINVNRWGMRDRDYERDKPPATFRVAVLGSSYVMGASVDDRDVFEHLVEEGLNRDLAGRPGGYARYELLNFGMAAYSQLAHLDVVRWLLSPWRPDVALVFVLPDEGQWLELNLLWALAAGVELPRELARIAPDLRAGLPRDELRRRVLRKADEILAWAWKEIDRELRLRGVRLVFVLLPRTDRGFSDDELQATRAALAATGAPIISMLDVFDGHDDIQASATDFHPNALGHRLIAARLRVELERLQLLGRGGQGAK